MCRAAAAASESIVYEQHIGIYRAHTLGVGVSEAEVRGLRATTELHVQHPQALVVDRSEDLASAVTRGVVDHSDATGALHREERADACLDCVLRVVGGNYELKLTRDD